jgi:HEAT repeat protein
MVGVDERIEMIERLGRLCDGHPENVHDALPHVIDGLGDDEDHGVLIAVADALGRMWDPRCLEPLLTLVHHEDRAVRLAATQALNGAMCNHETDEGLAALIRLTTDEDDRIRDWATFILANQAADSIDIREALWARIDDGGGETRGEALVGLARRKDPRARDQILQRLSDNPGNLIVEAAAELGDPNLYPELLRLRNEHWQEHNSRPSVLDEALTSCRPIE